MRNPIAALKIAQTFIAAELAVRQMSYEPNPTEQEARDIADATAALKAVNDALEPVKTIADFMAAAPKIEDPTNDALDAKYRALAKTQWHKEGEIEIDEGAIVDIGDDPGAYVAGWLWVDDPDRNNEEEKEDA